MADSPDAADTAPLTNYWMFGGDRQWLTETQTEIVPDGFSGAFRSGDIAFLRVPGDQDRDEIVAWGECFPTTDSTGESNVVISQWHPADSPLPLERDSVLWSLAYFRDPDHVVHGLSAREASIVIPLLRTTGLETPQVAGRGTIDEVLLLADSVAAPRGAAPEAVTKQAPIESQADEPALITDGHLGLALLLAGSVFIEAFPSAAAAFANTTDAEVTDDVTARLADRLQILGGRDRAVLWDPAVARAMPPFDADTRDTIALADALSRRMPIGSATTDAHVLVAGFAAEGGLRDVETRTVSEAVIASITADMAPDEAGNWWVAVGLPPRSTAIAAIAPDSTSGVDRLDRMPDIISFANAIASRGMQPPLSIGVFGEWGAGKTFFMRKLRDEIDRINANVANLPPNDRIGYCERIAQVEFNAWHYAETDLWSSLIHHLLAHLSVRRGDEEDVLTEQLLDELAEATAEVEAKQEAVARAEADVAGAEWRACVTEKRLAVAERRAAELTAKDVWAEVAADPDVRRRVDDLGRRFGRAPVGAAAIDLYHAVDDTIDLVTGGLNVLRLRDDDASVPTHRGRTVATMVAIVVLAAIAAFALDRVADLPVVAGAVVALGPLASAMTGIARWLDVQNRRGQRVVEDLTSARGRLEQRHDERIQVQQEQAAAARERVGRLVARQAEASAELIAAEARRNDAKQALDDVTPEDRLAAFVRSRTDEYQNNLGLVTAVRRDFEKLERLLRDVRTAADARRATPAENIADELVSAPSADDGPDRSGLSIDRVVVYIDDLDRCKPDTVVKVLEAVHLLLAFDFIVVVVGVDARWVGRSLLKTYPDMLGSGSTSPVRSVRVRRPASSTDGQVGVPRASDPAPPDPPAPPPDPTLIDDDAAPRPRELLQRPASEHDYIEKIFQVPYWLEPLDATTVGQLVSSVVGPVSVFGAGDVEASAADERRVAPELESQPFEVSADGRAAIDDLHRRLDESIGFNPNPASLTVFDRELQFMDVVYPLVSRSPRSAKRFVNVYRVIKAGLDQDDLDGWVASDLQPRPSQAVTLLLAIVCGAPQSSTAVLRELADLDDADDWARVADSIGRAMTGELADERRRWVDTRERYGKSEWIGMGADTIKPWLGRVARYSFRSGHLDLIRPMGAVPGVPRTANPAD